MLEECKYTLWRRFTVEQSTYHNHEPGHCYLSENVNQRIRGDGLLQLHEEVTCICQLVCFSTITFSLPRA